MNLPRSRSLLSGLLIVIGATIVWSEIFLAQRNVIGNKQHWHIAHEEFLDPNIVTLPIFTSPWLLHGYQLHSDQDMGIVRVLSEDSFVPESLTMFFWCDEEGFIDLIVNSTPESHLALRVGSSSLYPSALIEVEHSGKYRSHQRLDLPVHEGPQFITIREGNVSLNGKDISVPGLKFTRGKVGVQAHPVDAGVYGLRAVGKDETRWLHFFPDGPRFSLYARNFAVLSILILLFTFVPNVSRKKVGLFILGAGVIFFFWDFLLGVNRGKTPAEIDRKFSVLDSWWLPPGEPTLKKKCVALKKNDADTVVFLCTQKGCERIEPATPPEKKGTRIVIFGGSQSKYALITKFEESTHFQFDHYLREKRPNVETINIASPGLLIDRMKAYGRTLPLLKPDILIIETLAEEGDHEALRNLLTETKKAGVRMVLLRTPQNLLKFDEENLKEVVAEIHKGLDTKKTDVPRDPAWLPLKNVPFLKAAKDEFGFTFLDPNDLIIDEQIRRTGQFFWDRTHMTIYGQSVFGKWLAEEMAKLN